MITGLCMHNFKSWKDTGQVRIAPLTGLFGTNSSGKTAILQMLLLLKQTVESNDQSIVLNTGNDNSYVDVGSFFEIVHNKKMKEDVVFSIDWLPHMNSIEIISKRQSKKLRSSRKKIKNWRIKITMGTLSQKVILKEFIYTLQTQNEKYGSGLVLKNDQQNNLEYEIISVNYELIDIVSYIEPQKSSSYNIKPIKCYKFSFNQAEDYFNAPILFDSSFEFEINFKEMYYLGPLRDYPHRIYTWSGQTPQDVGTKGERAIEALLAADQWVTEEVAFWLKELKLVHNFSVKPIAQGRREHEVLVQSYENGPEVPITDVGFGVSQLLPVLVLCYYVPEGATVLLEQPEIHLHPSVQAGLADIFIDVIKNRGLQIILESHSEHLLRRLQRRIAEEEFSEEQAALYFCEQNDQGESQITSLKLDEYGNITNWPKNFFGDDFEDISAMTEAAIRRKKAAKGK